MVRIFRHTVVENLLNTHKTVHRRKHIVLDTCSWRNPSYQIRALSSCPRELGWEVRWSESQGLVRKNQYMNAYSQLIWGKEADGTVTSVQVP